MSIHPTAIVSKNAKIGKGVVIGPYSVVSDNVEIGDNTLIGAHCLIDGYTRLGHSCEIFTGAVIGSRPQDLKYKGEKTQLIIGNSNIIREYSTFNPGTEVGGKTVVGDRNLFMAYSHVAHDCTVGSDCVIANNGTLAGHVTLEDQATIGGLVAIHQFVHVGKLSIIGGCSKVVQDIPPYSTCDGHPARVFGLNLVGLRRHNVARSTIHALDRAFKILFDSGLSVTHAVERIEKESDALPEISHLIAFVKNTQRGLVRSCRVEKTQAS